MIDTVVKSIYKVIKSKNRGKSNIYLEYEDIVI
jgi:hypothetical protein